MESQSMHGELKLSMLAGLTLGVPLMQTGARLAFSLRKKILVGTGAQPEAELCSLQICNVRCRSGTAVLQPSVQFILTFSNVQASAVTDPKALQALVAADLETYAGSNALAKLTEEPMASGQNWALNVTVFLEPDTMSQVTSSCQGRHPSVQGQESAKLSSIGSF